MQKKQKILSQIFRKRLKKKRLIIVTLILFVLSYNLLLSSAVKQAKNLELAEETNSEYITNKKFIQDSVFYKLEEQNISLKGSANTINIGLLYRQFLDREEQRHSAFYFTFGAFVMLVLLLLTFYFARKRRKKIQAHNYTLYKNLRKLENDKAEVQILQQKLHEQVQKYSSENSPEAKKILLFNKIKDLLVNKKLYQDFDINAESLAKMLYTNTQYIHHAVKYGTDVSFNQYLNAIRMQSAMTALSENPDIAIKELAYNCGLTPQQFRTLFKRETGLSPNEYKLSVKQQARNA